MKSQFRHVALIGKYQAVSSGATRAFARQVMETVAHFLMDHDCEVVVEVEAADSMGLVNHPVADVATIGATCDLCVGIGGDGTMLRIGREMAQHGVPMIGINQGRLGFITDIALLDFQSRLGPMLAGMFEEDCRSLMAARVMRDGHCVFSAQALNDAVVNRGATAGMVELRVEVDGHFVANQRADGMIIATPTGSTAYALSAGGPLVHPTIAGWVLVPIAPHTLSNRPIVFPNAAEVAIELLAGRDASASFDQQSLASLLHGDRIVVTRSKYQARFLRPKGWTYFDTLRQKLHWNEEVV